MGKFVDLVAAILLLVIGLYVLTRLGITWSGIWKMIHSFFSGSSSTTNGTASSILLGMAASNRFQVLIGILTMNSKRR